ncbi:multiple epidermal growth factor-like domains protein 6 [Elysia marginata]|uniref:Multiple epidermal growth factor-like domains protein 6 n=1 Tax=Elysia marginata TaxID=1093978 RepID=A0AAV4JVN4_9GAST|nr:multiple epidermal growth factor-like domains protein 6 [Elysia marginata]
MCEHIENIQQTCHSRCANTRGFITPAGLEEPGRARNAGCSRPNVCPYEDMAMVMVRQPCVQAFTRLVKVWKPNCGYTRNWCVGYERRDKDVTPGKPPLSPVYDLVVEASSEFRSPAGHGTFRTHYYTTYKEKYQPQKVTKYKCCNGWTQGDKSGSCNNRVCVAGTCYNGGQCNNNNGDTGGSGGSPAALCSCPPGFQGSRCQYVAARSSIGSSLSTHVVILTLAALLLVSA